MRGQFKFNDKFTYRMPVHFIGYPFNNSNRVFYSDVFGIMMSMETEMEALAQFVPEDFEILEARVDYGYTNCRGVDFMSNGEYRIFQAAVPVKYLGNDKGFTGVYPLIIWENNPWPIFGGREEDGMPKLYADISAERHRDDHWFAAVSFECNTFAKINFWDKEKAPKSVIEEGRKNCLVNNFGWRYIPNVDGPGATASQAVLYPQEMYPKSDMWFGVGKITINKLDWVEHAGQFTIIDALADLPNKGFKNAMRMKAEIRLCVADSKPLP